MWSIYVESGCGMIIVISTPNGVHQHAMAYLDREQLINIIVSKNKTCIHRKKEEEEKNNRCNFDWWMQEIQMHQCNDIRHAEIVISSISIEVRMKNQFKNR